MPQYKVSKDGKTVTVGGKTYSMTAFRKQFDIGMGGRGPGDTGTTRHDKPFVTPKQIDTSPRTQGGIAAGASKRVNPVYKMMGKLGGGGIGGMFGVKNR